MKINITKIPVVIEEYKSGQFTNAELAVRHQVSPPTIANWIRHAGVPRKRPGRKPLVQPSETHRQIIELSAELSSPELSKRFGLSRQRIHQILDRWKHLRPERGEPPVFQAAEAVRQERRELRSEIVSFRLTGKQTERVRATLMSWGLGNRLSSSCACRAVVLAAVGLGRFDPPNNGKAAAPLSQKLLEQEAASPSNGGVN